MNIPKLLDIKQAILTYPDHFDMGDFYTTLVSDDSDETSSPELAQVAGETLNPHACGTTACIAGWAVALNQDEVGAGELFWDTAAAKVLGLTARQAQELFYAHDEFEPGTFIASKSIPLWKIQAADAIQAIDSLIKTGSAIWPDHLPRQDLGPSWWAGSNRERWVEYDASLEV